MITNFQVCLTQPSRKKTLIARKSSKDWFNSSRVTRTGTRWYRIWTRLKSSIRSVKSRRSWSPIWATRNSSTFAVLSIFGYVIKKIPAHGGRHGPSGRQTMYLKAHDMLRKARNNKNGSCKTIRERWHRESKRRKSLSKIGWTEEKSTLPPETWAVVFLFWEG